MQGTIGKIYGSVAVRYNSTGGQDIGVKRGRVTSLYPRVSIGNTYRPPHILAIIEQMCLNLPPILCLQIHLLSLFCIGKSNCYFGSLSESEEALGKKKKCLLNKSGDDTKMK